VVARLQASYRSLRWRQHDASVSSSDFDLESSSADMSAEG
jgi:hypothetical protein